MGNKRCPNPACGANNWHSATTCATCGEAPDAWNRKYKPPPPPPPPPPKERSVRRPAIAQARDRAASSAPAPPSRASLANLSRAADWTRNDEDRLLLALEDGKTGQELADAVGGGRTVKECEAKLEKLKPLQQLAYPWDPSDPRKHTEKIRAQLPAAEQNLSATVLQGLWASENDKTCVDAVKRVLNLNLGERWDKKPQCMEKLVAMGLPPSAFAKRPGFRRPPLRLSETFKRHSESLKTLMHNVTVNRAARAEMLAGAPRRSPYALLNDDGTRKDQSCYAEMRSKACCLVALSMGANPNMEMPTAFDFVEISQWTTKPSFERLALPREKESFAEASYARQFCFICDSLFVFKGGRVFVEHCKKRKHRRGVHGFCRMCNTGVIFLADVIRAAVAKAGVPRPMSVALKAVDKIADKYEVKPAVFKDMF
jgi:hypothetical protein